jgi:hypothetical protein
MKKDQEGALEPYLINLKGLAVVADAKATNDRRTKGWRLQLKTHGGRRMTYAVEHIEAPPTAALAGRLAEGRTGGQDHRWMVLAPRVTPRIGAVLIGHDIDYMDLAGNCHVAPAPDQLVHVEKKGPERIRGTRTFRPQGYQVLFALLARPELIAEPVREIAVQAGVGKTVAGQTLERLEEEGYIRKTRRGRNLYQPEKLVPRWLTGYADILRPRWVLGRFRTPEAGREHLAERVEDYFRNQTEEIAWGFGGTVAADNLTPHYRGREIVVHAERLPADFGHAIRALPAEAGELTVLRAPGPIGYKGPRPHIVHPLLVYTELMTGDDERAWEAAKMVLEQYLPALK